ncbi:MAG: hypothetical protein PHE43_03955 [Candidatus Nanoarchaeia archaeon]|nr:hypothetical protein [Candidatus Nanoarchaeia archaeon]
MKYKAKCIIVSRTKREVKTDTLGRPCNIALFNINDAHKTTEAPLKVLDFKGIEKVVVKGLRVDFFLAGADLVINKLKNLDISLEGKQKENLVVTVKQE